MFLLLIERMHELTFSKALELRNDFFERTGFPVSLISELQVKVADGNGELPDHGLAKASKHVIVDLARKPWAKERVDG